MVIRYIYKLKYKQYYYIGQSNNYKRRYKQHIKSCFNRCKKSYWTKLYHKLRILGIKNKDDFNNKVKLTIVCICNDENVDFIENNCINMNNYNCLNTLRGKNFN